MPGEYKDMGKKDWLNKEARDIFARTVNTLLMKYTELPDDAELEKILTMSTKITKRNLAEFS